MRAYTVEEIGELLKASTTLDEVAAIELAVANCIDQYKPVSMMGIVVMIAMKRSFIVNPYSCL